VEQELVELVAEPDNYCTLADHTLVEEELVAELDNYCTLADHALVEQELAVEQELVDDGKLADYHRQHLSVLDAADTLAAAAAAFVGCEIHKLVAYELAGIVEVVRKLHLTLPPGIAVAAADAVAAAVAVGTAAQDYAAGVAVAGHDELGLVVGRQDGCKPQAGPLRDNYLRCSVGRCSTHY
jgi:hypothetical protein